MRSALRSPDRRPPRSLPRLGAALFVALIALSQVAVGRGYRMDVGDGCGTAGPAPVEAAPCCCGPADAAGACSMPMDASEDEATDACDCRVAPDPAGDPAPSLSPTTSTSEELARDLAIRASVAAHRPAPGDVAPALREPRLHSPPPRGSDAPGAPCLVTVRALQGGTARVLAELSTLAR